MFADELKGNASRKRQDQARNRRRQIKLDREKKEKQKRDLENSKSQNNKETKSDDNGNDSSHAPASLSTAESAHSSISSGNATEMSAVEKALEQRKLRAKQKLEITSVTIIQSRFRSYRSNVQLVQNQTDILQKRLTDIITLEQILKQTHKQKQQVVSGSSPVVSDSSDSSFIYVPPPALTSTMVNQLLVITHAQNPFNTYPKTIRRDVASIKSSSNEENIISLTAKLVNHILIPGILSTDINMDPFYVWVQSKGGLFKLQKLLRLCCYTYMNLAHYQQLSIEAQKNIVHTLDRFFRIILRVPTNATNDATSINGMGQNEIARSEVATFCKSLLFSFSWSDSNSIPTDSIVLSSMSGSSNNNETENKKKSDGDYSVGISNIREAKEVDLIYFLRLFLLRPSSDKNWNGGASSILPITAETLREKCILSLERMVADAIFNLVLSAIILADFDEIGSGVKQSNSLNNSGEGEKLRKRFFAEILTCPLLTWKIEPKTVSKLIRVGPMYSNQKKGTTNKNPPLFQCMSAFISHHEREIADGELGRVLPFRDLSLKACPAPNVMCLLSNLVLLGKSCPVEEIDRDVAAMHFNFLSALIDTVPLGSFSSRESAVEWIGHGGAQLTQPVVLSSVIRDQCKLILMDSYVCMLFNYAIDKEALNSDVVIARKTSDDIALENELKKAGGSSGAIDSRHLAAKEAMVERSEKFWQSKWAKKLSKKVSTMFSGGEKNAKVSSRKGQGRLVDTSSVSRQLADGTAPISEKVKHKKSTEEEPRLSKSKKSYKPNLFFALCRTYCAILSRWGGDGKDDIVKRTPMKGNGHEAEDAARKIDPCVLSLLNTLSFSTQILITSWVLMQSEPTVVSKLHEMLNAKVRPEPIRSVNLRPTFKNSGLATSSDNIGYILLFIFGVSFQHTLIITDDVEIHEMNVPLPVHHIRRCILLLKTLLHRACCLDDTKSSASRTAPSNHFGLSLISSCAKTMRDLYDRSSRRPLCMPKLWLCNDLLEPELRNCKTQEDYIDLLSSPVLRISPFLVSFKRRLKLFERIVTTNREAIQGRNDGHSMRPGISVSIMRGRVLEDGLIHLNKLGRNLRQRLIVHYLSQAGTKEIGIDAGGLFKEFWTDLSALSFNPNYALFRVTEDSTLYPNPSSRAAHGSDSIILFEFLGRILGKALYEGITIQPQFAHFFLSFLRGDYNFLHMLEDLRTMDPTLYNNLMFLKTYEGDASDLCLTFTVSIDDFGSNKEVQLMANGESIDVTNYNKHRYVEMVAKHYVCDRVKEQAKAFTRGLWDVIDQDWLRIFNEPELQVLISGPSDGKIDLLDMKANTQYAGGYNALDRNISRFWNTVSSFNDKQQADLLRFVTSCERPPPLGFGSMNPPFTIQRAGGGLMGGGNMLPTASTCFNILKLPPYGSEKVLRERLLYAISSGAGFELS